MFLKDKSFESTSATFFKCFYPNNHVTCDTINDSAKISEKTNQTCDPIIRATAALKAKNSKVIYNKKIVTSKQKRGN